MKKLLLCLSTLFSLSICNGNATNEVFKQFGSRKEAIARTPLDHPTISGFTYETGDRQQVIATEPTGYFYYDADIYYSEFTTNSRLYIIHLRVDFTPGSAASKIDSKYDWHYDLWSGEIQIEAERKWEGNRHTSSLQYAKSWPLSNSDTTTYSVSSSFGGNYTISKDIEAGAKFGEGAGITEKTSHGFTLGFEKTTTIYGEEPGISAQKSPDQTKDIYTWVYQYHVQSGLTFRMNTYYMFEVKNDGTLGSQYSFDYNIKIKMTNVAWRTYWWEQHKDTATDLNRTYGH